MKKIYLLHILNCLYIGNIFNADLSSNKFGQFENLSLESFSERFEKASKTEGVDYLLKYISQRKEILQHIENSNSGQCKKLSLLRACFGRKNIDPSLTFFQQKGLVTVLEGPAIFTEEEFRKDFNMLEFDKLPHKFEWNDLFCHILVTQRSIPFTIPSPTFDLKQDNADPMHMYLQIAPYIARNTEKKENFVYHAYNELVENLTDKQTTFKKLPINYIQIQDIKNTYLKLDATTPSFLPQSEAIRSLQTVCDELKRPTPSYKELFEEEIFDSSTEFQSNIIPRYFKEFNDLLAQLRANSPTKVKTHVTTC